MSQIPRFNIQGAPPHEYTIGVVCDPNDAHRHGAVIGSFGSAFAATRTFTPGIFAGDPYAFRHGFVGAEMAGARHPEPQPNYAGMVAVESVPYQPTPEQLRDREEHKKAFYTLYSENYRDIEHKKTKLIRKSVHSEATRVLKILKSGRHPSEADVDSDTAAAMRQASGAAGGSAVQDEAERDPTLQPAKRARKMPRRFYHYTRVYMLHNYSGKLALAYRPDSTAAEGGGEAGDERAGKPPRMVTNFEDVFEAMADVHYKKDFHVKVGVTEKILRDVYYNIPRNCIKAFVQTCKCQQARPKRETEEERQRRKSPISGETAAASSAGLKGQEGRASLSGSCGAVVWLTGRSGVGKSTIAALLEERLLGKAVLSLQLDPKVVCHGLCSDLGFTRLARAETLRRVTEVAKHVADAGLIAIASFVSPLRAERAAAREAFRPEQNRFFEVYVAAAKATLLARGGVDDSVPKDGRMEDAYEEPAAPELMLDTDQCSAEDCVRQIIRMLQDAGAPLPLQAGACLHSHCSVLLQACWCAVPPLASRRPLLRRPPQALPTLRSWRRWTTTTLKRRTT